MTLLSSHLPGFKQASLSNFEGGLFIMDINQLDIYEVVLLSD